MGHSLFVLSALAATATLSAQAPRASPPRTMRARND
jgi:hypothetical protein